MSAHHLKLKKLEAENRELREKLQARSAELEQEIRERADMEKWLVAARQAAIEGARLKSSFVANISHEIRTPIHAITGMLYALSETELTPLQRKYTSTIQKAAEALMVLLNDILDFSKMESGKLNLNIKDFELQEGIEQACESFAREITGRGLRWSLEIDPQLPVRVRSDFPRIRQVLTNFLNNASKFTQAGEIRLSVHKQESSGSRLWTYFEVRDTGIGIPESSRAMIFEEFSQVDASSSRKHGGVGLGLSICKKLVELLGGSIGYESEKGKGSAFWFVIPLDLVLDEAQIESPRARASGPWIRGRILLVEDNPVNQEVTATLLASMGHQVTIAENGRKAVELVRKEPFDLIIMDCQMPEMDGYQTTRAIREFERSGNVRHPIVAMTADAMKDAAARCLAAGMNDYLSKPVQVESLRDKLQIWLTQKGAELRTQVRLDESAINNLKSFKTAGAPNLFVKLVEIYLDDAPPRVLRMIEAIEAGNAKALEADAHYLKSASAALGANRLAQILLELEDLGKSYDPAKARALLTEFQSEYDSTVEELKARR